MANKYCGFTCFWRIENFDECQPNRNLLLESPFFSVKMLKNSKWHLELDQTEEGVLGLNLCKSNPGNSNINIKIYILKNAEWENKSDGFCKVKGWFGNGFGTNCLVSWDELKFGGNMYLPNGSLTVAVHMLNGATKNKYAQCFMTSRMRDKISLFHEENQEFCDLPESPDFPALNVSIFNKCSGNDLTKVVQKTTSSTQTDTTEYSNVFKENDGLICIFKENKFGFVTLRTENKDFAVHEALLCSKSPVFNAMFVQEMKERDSKIVDMDDVDGDTLSLFFQFLYLERLDSLEWDKAVKLYYVADKYQIEVLKQKCLSFLKKELSTENICEAFVIADMHQDEDLKQSGLEYFCKNSKFILPSEEWKNLMSKRLDLSSEILSEFAKKL